MVQSKVQSGSLQSKQEDQGTRSQAWAAKAALMAVIVLAMAMVAFHFAGSSSDGSLSAGSLSASSTSAGSNSASTPSSTGMIPSVVPALVSASPRPASQHVSAASLSFPMFFEPNVGQTDGRVKFLARGSGYGLFLTADEAVLLLQHPAAVGQHPKSNVVRMHLDSANTSARVQGAEQLPGKSNYFIGNKPSEWRTSVPQFARVEYQRVYPGIDLVYYGNQKQLEYDFHVAPGADPNQIALSFQGASAHLDSGDLVLSTGDGDIRFRAPHIYQQTGAQKHDSTSIAGGFRQLAANKIGFSLGSYDHSRELIIDPQLTYSTYLGAGGESLVSVAIDASSNIYVAGSTTASTFPTTAGAIQTGLGGAGAQNVFVAVLNPLAGTGSAQLLFATYLGGSGTDSLAQVAVDPGNASFPVAGNGGINIYLAGTTTSTNFPTTATNAFQASATFTGTQTHGFLSTINAGGSNGSNVFTLSYSTYIAGNIGGGIGGNDTSENDAITGLAVDSFFDAYITGTTTSTDVQTGFPSTPGAYQICPWQPAQSGGTPCPITAGPPQFFASEINTAGSGPQSMLYSTFFGGGYPLCTTCTPAAVVNGGGIAVDVVPNNPHSNINMYFTGTTNMWGGGVQIPNGASPFPLINAWQSCLNESGAVATGSGTGCNAPGSNTDAFVVKLNPNQLGAGPTYSTFLGGANNDTGVAVAADSIGNAYVTGGTYSTDWNCTSSCVFAPSPYGVASGTQDAYIAKVTDEEGGIFPLVFFAYIGGTQNADTGNTTGNAIVIDSVQSAHIAGTTTSSNLNVLNASQPSYGGAGDAFAALLSTTSTSSAGDYVTYLGGSGSDQGTGIALDVNATAYVAGVTQSSNFPSKNPYQSGLVGAQDAFVTQLGANSKLVVSNASGSPSPNPLPAGAPATFTFTITNNGPDAATNVSFTASFQTAGLQSQPTAQVLSSGSGSCTSGLNGTILCNVGTLAANATGEVAVFLTTTIPAVNKTVSVTGSASANGGSATSQPYTEILPITDFTINPSVLTPNINAGELAVINVTLTPDQTLGYNSTLTMSQSASPSMVTSPSPTFTIQPVVLSGTSQQLTVLNIQTVPRPINTGSLFRRKAFYAAWLPIGGLSLFALGIGARSRRRRWLIGMLLGLVAGLILLQPACGSGSSSIAEGGGTQPGIYTITITASPSTGAAHQTTATVVVN